MMKRLVSACFAVGVFALMAPQASAGFFRHCCGVAPCGGCYAGCGTGVACYPVAAPAAAAPAPQYVDQKVTYCKAVWVDQPVEYKVCEPKYTTKKENYSWVEYEHKVVKQKYTQNYCETVWVDEPCEYVVCEPKVTKVKKTITTCNYSYKTVTENVPVCRRVPVCDPCGGCCGWRHRCCYTTVTVMVPVCRTVCVATPVTQDVWVNECTYEKKVVKGTRKVCKLVPKTRDVWCDVCTCTPVKKSGTRDVTYCTYVEKVVKGTVKVCKYETVTETVKVPVGHCHDCCYGCGSCCHHRCGFRLFGWLHRCCH